MRTPPAASICGIDEQSQTFLPSEWPNLYEHLEWNFQGVHGEALALRRLQMTRRLCWPVALAQSIKTRYPLLQMFVHSLRLC